MLESDCGVFEFSIFRCPRVVVVCMYSRLSRTERFLPVCGDSTCYFVVTRTEITQHNEDSENSSISYSISTVMRLAHKHHIQSLCRREVTNVDSFAVITSRHNFPVAVLCPEALPRIYSNADHRDTTINKHHQSTLLQQTFEAHHHHHSHPQTSPTLAKRKGTSASSSTIAVRSSQRKRSVEDSVETVPKQKKPK
jgi:hypothetical protein